MKIFLFKQIYLYFLNFNCIWDDIFARLAETGHNFKLFFLFNLFMFCVINLISILYYSELFTIIEKIINFELETDEYICDLHDFESHVYKAFYDFKIKSYVDNFIFNHYTNVDIAFNKKNVFKFIEHLVYFDFYTDQLYLNFALFEVETDKYILDMVEFDTWIINYIISKNRKVLLIRYIIVFYIILVLNYTLKFESTLLILLFIIFVIFLYSTIFNYLINELNKISLINYLNFKEQIKIKKVKLYKLKKFYNSKKTLPKNARRIIKQFLKYLILTFNLNRFVLNTFIVLFFYLNFNTLANKYDLYT